VADLTFVIDASTSIDHPALCGKIGTFRQITTFVAEVVTRLTELGLVAAPKISVGVASFATEGKVETGFAADADARYAGAALASAARAIEHTGGGGVLGGVLSDSNIHLGLAAARAAVAANRRVGSARAARVTDYVVMVSDGLGRNSLGENATESLVDELSADFYSGSNVVRKAFHTGSCPDLGVLGLIAPEPGAVAKLRKRAGVTAAALVASIVADDRLTQWCRVQPTTTTATTTQTTTGGCAVGNCVECAAGDANTCARCGNKKYLAAATGSCLNDCSLVVGAVEEGAGDEGRVCRV
jgi:hypothetical protein